MAGHTQYLYEVRSHMPDDNPDENNDVLNLQDLDQAVATVGDMWPPLWRRIYDNLLSEGFTEQQAMSLLKTYIMASCGAAKS